MTTRHEAQIVLGVDTGGLSGAAAKVGRWASTTGETIGHLFTHGWMRVLHGLTLVGLVHEAYETLQVFREAKGDVDKLRDAFGELSEAEINAMKQADEAMSKIGKWQKHYMATVIDGAVTATKLMSNIWNARGSGKTMTQVLNETFFGGNAEEKQKSAQEEAQSRWEKHKTAIQKFNEAQEESRVREMDDSEKIVHWQGKIVELKKAMEAEQEAGHMKEVYEIATQILGLDGKILDARKHQSDELRTQTQLAFAAYEQKRDAERKLRDHGLEFTVDELAEAQGRNTPWGNQANDVLQLRKWAHENSMLGFTGKATWQQRRADEILDSLKSQNPFLINPLDEMRKGIDRAADALEFFKSQGMKIEVQE